MPDQPIWQLSAGELSRAYRRRDLSPLEVTEALADRIAARNDDVGAFTTLTLERAVADAAGLTEELAKGTRRGPLHGIPVGIKELFDVEDAVTTYGSPMLADRIAAADAAAVANWRLAGCIVIGLTRSHEFGWGITTQNPVIGSTVNPWAPDRVPGGSSGGTAAGLAMGFMPLGLGSDTGGSIRIPATFCGVAGFKPSYGRVSKRGAVTLAASLDHPGPLARRAADLAPAFDALAGYDPDDPTTLAAHLDLSDVEAGMDGLTVAVCPDLHLRPLWADHQRVFDQAVAAVEASGAKLVEVSFPNAAGIRPAFADIQMAEAHHYHHAVLGLYPDRRDEYGPDVEHRLALAADVTIDDYISAKTAAAEYRRTFHQIFVDVDLVLSPVTGGGPAPVTSPNKVTKDGETVPFRDLVMDYTVPQDLAGLPACAVPVGTDDDGIPVAAQLTAAFGNDAIALRGGTGLEAAIGGPLGFPTLAIDPNGREG